MVNWATCAFVYVIRQQHLALLWNDNPAAQLYVFSVSCSFFSKFKFISNGAIQNTTMSAQVISYDFKEISHFSTKKNDD